MIRVESSLILQLCATIFLSLERLYLVAPAQTPLNTTNPGCKNLFHRLGTNLDSPSLPDRVPVQRSREDALWRDLPGTVASSTSPVARRTGRLPRGPAGSRHDRTMSGSSGATLRGVAGAAGGRRR